MSRLVKKIKTKGRKISFTLFALGNGKTGLHLEGASLTFTVK